MVVLQHTETACLRAGPSQRTLGPKTEWQICKLMPRSNHLCPGEPSQVSIPQGSRESCLCVCAEGRWKSKTSQSQHYAGLRASMGTSLRIVLCLFVYGISNYSFVPKRSETNDALDLTDQMAVFFQKPNTSHGISVLSWLYLHPQGHSHWMCFALLFVLSGRHSRDDILGISSTHLLLSQECQSVHVFKKHQIQ